MKSMPWRQAEIKVTVLSQVTLHPSRSTVGDFMGGTGTSKPAVIFFFMNHSAIDRGLYKFCE